MTASTLAARNSLAQIAGLPGPIMMVSSAAARYC
jgi:hypothetical protein